MVKGKQIQKHGYQCALPQFYFYFIFIFGRETIFYFQKVFVFIVHQIFVFSAKLAQSWDKTAWTWTKRHFATYSLWALKGNLCLLCMACIFFCWCMYRALVCSPMEFEHDDLPIDFESFPTGVSPERYTSKVYDCINLDGTMIKHDTMSYLINEGYLT